MLAYRGALSFGLCSRDLLSGDMFTHSEVEEYLVIDYEGRMIILPPFTKFRFLCRGGSNYTWGRQSDGTETHPEQPFA